MKTVRMLGNKKVEVIDVPEPEPAGNLVVVKIMSSVLCGVEHHYYYASEPMESNFGHEAAGVGGRVGFLGNKNDTIPVSMLRHVTIKELTLIGRGVRDS